MNNDFNFQGFSINIFHFTTMFRSFCKQLTWPETPHTCLIYREVAFKFYTSNAEKVILLKSGYFCYNVVSTQPKKPSLHPPYDPSMQ